MRVRNCLRWLFGMSTLVVASYLHAAAAAGIRATIYDDGLSCPAGCDAHVVFASALNGTAYAHSPDSPSGRYKKCPVDTECRICFDSSSSNCMTVIYRGDGPHARTFDFTPAFYEAHCSESNLPTAVADECKSLVLAAKALVARVNCLRNPDHGRCIQLIRSAKELQAQDRPVYEQCVQMGESAFNKDRPLVQQRANACAYEKKGTGGPNSRGKTWRRLLPGACRENTYVGRDGTDCCTGNPMADGGLGPECSAFYPKP